MSVAYIGPNSRTERPRKTTIGTDEPTSHLTRTPLWRSKVKGQLVADVLNSQHAGTGATRRINTKILSTCRGRRHVVSPLAQLASDSPNLFCSMSYTVRALLDEIKWMNEWMNEYQANVVCHSQMPTQHSYTGPHRVSLWFCWRGAPNVTVSTQASWNNGGQLSLLWNHRLTSVVWFVDCIEWMNEWMIKNVIVPYRLMKIYLAIGNVSTKIQSKMIQPN